MIKLTLTDGTETLVNPDQIEKVDQQDSTILRLKNGNSLKVQETLQLVLNLIKSLGHRDSRDQ